MEERERAENIYRALKSCSIQAISELHGDWHNKAPQNLQSFVVRVLFLSRAHNLNGNQLEEHSTAAGLHS